MNRTNRIRWGILILLTTVWAAVGRTAPLPVDFAREIQPLLSDKCYHCHGPDEPARKARLRFDTQEGAFRLRDGRAVIIPAKPKESELVRRILSRDPDEQMPPPDSHRSLSATETALLERWVAEGASWGRHWSFEPPRRLTPPTPKRTVTHPVDAFVQHRLEAVGLSLSPASDPARLLRRVTLDLTGLPPTLAELDAFVADPSPAAYRQAVDRLLASPRFGERMAVEWLDLARYADTHGFQSDRYRPMWAYRDWVIGALNRNLPYDQFVTWQLAGDLLPHATQEQRLATAFNRLHLQNEEGGIVAEEFRVAYVVDRVNTFGTAFLGLTLECARCHDHKYDPVSQKDYYQLFAFFQNIDESGQTSYFTDSMPVPTVLLTTPEQERTLAGWRATLQASARTLSVAEEKAATGFDAWLAAGLPSLSRQDLSGAVVDLRFQNPVTNKFTNLADPAHPATLVDAPKLIPGSRNADDTAVELSGENGVTVGGVATFGRADPFTISIRLQIPHHAPRATVLHKAKAWMDAASRGYELVLEDGHAAIGLHHMWPGNALKVRTRATLPTNTWVDVAFSYDGSSRAGGVRVYFDGVRQDVEILRDNLWKDIRYGDEPPLTLGFRMRDNGFKDGRVDELAVFARELSPPEIAVLAGRETSVTNTPAWREYFLRQNPDVAVQRTNLNEARRGQSAFINPIPEAMGMAEMPTPKPAFILKRGAYDAPGEAVHAEVPGALPRIAADQPRNRLSLARWLLDPGHPLFARVTVNRFWQQFFGRGLVASTDNFGVQGGQPSNPELLDWLAGAFSQGTDQLTAWDIKGFCRLLVLSETYRQASQAGADLVTRDPENQWLAHASPRRLTAEMLRDQALFASGLLSEKIGGASVRPYQPDGLWEVAFNGAKYDQSKGADLYRRSMYTYWKRTVPPPAMTTFDAAERNVCIAKRQSTSTPLQALVLLNDLQWVEAARLLGQRMLREGGDAPAGRVRHGFRLATSREPNARELAVLEKLWAEQETAFTQETDAAEKLLGLGETRSDPALPIPSLAAATVVAQALLNLDEALMRR